MTTHTKPGVPMMRPDRILHDIPVSKWSRDEAVSHLEVTFDQAARQRPDLMEAYLIRLDGATESEQVAIMREGLRETFTRRYPRRFARNSNRGV
jgi:hypothetical protein